MKDQIVPMSMLVVLTTVVMMEAEGKFHLEIITDRALPMNENLFQTVNTTLCGCKNSCLSNVQCSTATASRLDGYASRGVAVTPKEYGCYLHRVRSAPRSFVDQEGAVTMVKRYEGFELLDWRYCGVEETQRQPFNRSDVSCDVGGQMAYAHTDRDMNLIIRLLRQRRVLKAWVALWAGANQQPRWIGPEQASRSFAPVGEVELANGDPRTKRCYAIDLSHRPFPALVPAPCTDQLPAVCCTYV